MADTTIYALIGSLLVTLTVIPLLCVLVLRNVRERRNPCSSGCATFTHGC